jgi:hypothetical protein
MAKQEPSRDEVRITISVGPDNNILGHDEVCIFRHVEAEPEEFTVQRVVEAVRAAMLRIGW